MKDRVEWLDSLNLKGQGVEVGVGGGAYSDLILRRTGLDRLFSVDPWTGWSDDMTPVNGPDLYVSTVRRLIPFGARSVILRMKSLEASELFRSVDLNFVYIDANHEYEFIRNDIRVWYEVLNSGGILAGHDYCDTRYGVKQAVDEFALRINQSVNLTDCDQVVDDQHIIRTWWFET